MLQNSDHPRDTRLGEEGLFWRNFPRTINHHLPHQKKLDKLGLSCAKLRPAYISYPLVFGYLAYAMAAFMLKYAYLNKL